MFDTLSPELRAVVTETLTDKERDAVELWSRGCGYGRIALMLDISVSTARDRVKRGIRRIEKQFADDPGMNAWLDNR